MTTRSLTVCVAAAALAVALGSRAGPVGASQTGATRARAGGEAIYAFAGQPARLYRADPRTLALRHGRSAAVAGHLFGWSFSPDRSRLAAGSDATGELRLYDLRRLRALGDVALVRGAVRGLVVASTWASRSRVLAVVVSPGCCGLGDTTVGAVDADARRVVSRHDLRGSLQAGAAYRGGFVLVLGPRWSIGSSRLVVVDPDGRVRTARLDRTRSGWHPSGTGAHVIAHQWSPGLAVDASSGRAFVVQQGAPAAEVDLRSLTVRYHDLAQPVSLLGRLHDWLEPKAAAKGMQGPQRHAVWLGEGRFAVTGADFETTVDAHGEEQEVDRPAGLKLVDTRTWSVRTLDSTSTRALRVGGVLFAFGTSWDSRTRKTTADGLTAYDTAGHELYHRYGRNPVFAVRAIGRGVLVTGNQGHQDLVEPRSGRLIGRAPADVELFDGDQDFWF